MSESQLDKYECKLQIRFPFEGQFEECNVIATKDRVNVIDKSGTVYIETAASFLRMVDRGMVKAP